ncbi:MAG TPA: hypothetical protein VJV79_23390 [Polyangiaceae bacterium]|nr:hypothetical protein [Polyangiaceae bacterium]
MNKQAVFDKIKVAKQELSEAEASVGKVLRDLKGGVRADKSVIGAELEAAFSKVKLANRDLAELEQLIEGALD